MQLPGLIEELRCHQKNLFYRVKIKNRNPVIPPTTNGITKNISFEEIVIIPAAKSKNLIDKRAEEPSIPSNELMHLQLQ